MADNSERTALLQEAGDSDAFTICDQHLTVLDVDESALRYLGGKPNRADVIGQNLADLTDRERCDRYLRVMETGERFVAEESLLLPDGEKACVVTRAFKVGDHLAILISDVTAERLAQAVAR